MNIATSEGYKNKEGEWVNETEWHSVVVWGPVAERVKRFRKGEKIYVKGKNTTRTYEKDGEKKWIKEVRGIVVRNLSVKNSDRMPSEVPADVEARNNRSVESETKEEVHESTGKSSDGLPF